MTDERVVSYLEEYLLSEDSRFVCIENADELQRFVYVRVTGFDNQILTALEEHGLSFRSLESPDKEYRLFCYFVEEFIDDGVRIDKGAYNLKEYHVLDNEQD